MQVVPEVLSDPALIHPEDVESPIDRELVRVAPLRRLELPTSSPNIQGERCVSDVNNSYHRSFFLEEQRRVSLARHQSADTVSLPASVAPENGLDRDTF